MRSDFVRFGVGETHRNNKWSQYFNRPILDTSQLIEHLVSESMKLRVPSDSKPSSCIINYTNRSQMGVGGLIDAYEGDTSRYRDPLMNPIH